MLAPIKRQHHDQKGPSTSTSPQFACTRVLGLLFLCRHRKRLLDSSTMARADVAQAALRGLCARGSGSNKPVARRDGESTGRVSTAQTVAAVRTAMPWR